MRSLKEIFEILNIDIEKLEQYKDMSIEDYFHNNQFSIDAFKKKYALNNENYYQCIYNVCDYIASAEKTNELKEYWRDRWLAEILFDYWQPGGSIISGSNNQKKISMMNCTTIALSEDSLESIFRQTAYKVARTASYRQGLGVEYSKLRPRNSVVNNSSNFSNGACSWMSFIDSISYYVGQKGRIPAQLMSLNCKHPDLEEFIQLKSNNSSVQNANISVQLTNDFYKAVEKDKDWEMEFIVNEIKIGDKLYLDIFFDDINLADGKDENGYYQIAKFNRKKEIISKKKSARELLKMIALNMMNSAEPGIQNIDIAKKYSNSDAVGFPIISTNACSEQYLDEDGNCCLASSNCSKFYDSEKMFNEEKLEIISESMTRFLDNVIQKELDDKRSPTYKQRISLESLRRIGAGFTNIVGLLLRHNLAYGDEKANELIEKFSEKQNYFLYKHSIKIGKEKGSFKAFDKQKYCQSEFIKSMMNRFNDLEFNTMRNVCVSSIAPTGTLSLMFSDLVTSYGIEPAFFMYYWKRTRISGEYKYYFCISNDVRKIFEERGYKIPIDSDSIEDTWDGKHGREVAEFIEKNKSNVKLVFNESTGVNHFNKLELMSRVMKNVDSSISVTYNLPENSNENDIYNFILEAYKKNVKSIAAFPDKKMYGIVSKIPFKELAQKLLQENVLIHSQNFSEKEKQQLDISFDNIGESSAPKRPNTLNADIYCITVKGQKFVLAVGLLNNKPYEVFGGHMNGLNFKFNSKKGAITKISKGKYKLEFDDFEVEDFSMQFTPVEKSLFRLLSSNLRHGVPVKYIVEQLNKAEDEMFSLQSAASRVLKKYIQDNETVTGAECPECKQKNTLIYMDGCVQCSNCNYQKCN